MKRKTFKDLGFAKVDHHRQTRKGFPEVIFCPGKTNAQITKIAKEIAQHGHPVLATRATPKNYQAVKRVLRGVRYHKEARILSYQRKGDSRFTIHDSLIAIVTAGTADIPVAEEAAVTAEFLGLKVKRFYDVGVAGVHRLIKNIDQINQAQVIIVVAGMEGALPSVVGGLVDKPVIAVPTSIGYGASFKGLSALLTMMNTCAPGVAVVNIDNGFGAAVMAFTIVRISGHQEIRISEKG